MRNLLALLVKYHFFLLFVIFEIWALYMAMQFNNYHSVSAYNTAQRIAGSYYNRVTAINEYLTLRKNNQMLVAENARLRSLLDESKMAVTDSAITVTDTTHRQLYSYITAKIINNTTDKQYNYITLNKGRLDGVEPGMGVISGNGVVGVVANVTPHYSSLISVLNRELKISTKFYKNNFFGAFNWDGINYRYGELADIPLHVQVKKGDLLVTTGFSSIFPEGIPVGFVEDFDVTGGNFYRIRVEIANDFRSLTHVNVVVNLKKQEMQELESQNKRND